MIGLYLRSAPSPLHIALGLSLVVALQACGDDTGNAGTTSTGGGQGAAGNTGNGAGAGTGNQGGDGNLGNGGSGNAAGSGNGGGGNAGGTGNAGGSGGTAGGPAGGDGGIGGDGASGGNGGGGSGGDGGGGTAGAGGNGGVGGSGGNLCGAGGNGGGGTGGSGPEVVIPLAGVTVTTLAGGDTAGFTDGTGADAEFNNPVNVIVDDVGSIYIADFENSAIRYATALGDVGTPLSFQTGFARPFGMAYTQAGELFVQTDLNPQGGSSDASGTIWEVDYLAGVATPVLANIGRPRGLAAVGTSIVMSDVNHHAIRILDPTGPTVTDLAGLWPCPGFANGSGEDARFRNPYGIARRPSGDIVVADQGNNAIRLVTMAGNVTTLAGDGSPGMVDGTLATARFNQPRDVAVDSSGRIYVSDTGNHRIRRIDPGAGTVVTVAGDGVAGFADGSGTTARFFGQEGIDVTPDGQTLYVADGTVGTVQPYHRVRVISLP